MVATSFFTFVAQKLESTSARLTPRSTGCLYAALPNGLYAAPGYLLYVRDRTLVAQAFSPRQLEVTGEPVPLAENTPVNGTSGSVVFSVSDTGVLAYETGIPGKLRQLTWVDRDGTSRGTVGEPGVVASPRISPDGEKFVVTLTDPQGDQYECLGVRHSSRRTRTSHVRSIVYRTAQLVTRWQERDFRLQSGGRATHLRSAVQWNGTAAS